MRFLFRVGALLIITGFVLLVQAMLNLGPSEKRKPRFQMGCLAMVLGLACAGFVANASYEMNAAIQAERESIESEAPSYGSTLPATPDEPPVSETPPMPTLGEMAGSAVEGSSLLIYATAGLIVFGFYRLVCVMLRIGPSERRKSNLYQGLGAFGAGVVLVAVVVALSPPEAPPQKSPPVESKRNVPYKPS